MADKKPDESPNVEITVDLSAWRMKQIKQWQNATNGTFDIDTLNQLMTGCVKTWPFAGDPSDLSAYDDLEMDDWASVLGAVNVAARAIFQNAFNKRQ